MQKENSINKYNKIDIKRTFSFSIIILYLSLCFIFDYEPISKNIALFGVDYEMIPSLWGVQATISILSITIFMMLTERLERRYYGLTLLEVLSNNKTPLTCFNFLENIIVCFLLIFINVINVIFNSMNGFMIVFLINAYILIAMIVYAFQLLSDEDRCKKEAEKYINNIEIGSNNYKKWIKGLEIDFNNNKNKFSYIDISKYLSIIKRKIESINIIEDIHTSSIYISAIYCSEYSNIHMNLYDEQNPLRIDTEDKVCNENYINSLIGIFKNKSSKSEEEYNIINPLKYFISSYLDNNGRIELLVWFLQDNYENDDDKENIELNYIFVYLFIEFIKNNNENEINIFLDYIYKDYNIKKYITFILISLFILSYLYTNNKFSKLYKYSIKNNIDKKHISIKNINNTLKLYNKFGSNNNNRINEYFLEYTKRGIEPYSGLTWPKSTDNVYYIFVLYQLILAYDYIKNDIQNIDNNIAEEIMKLFEIKENEIILKNHIKENIEKIAELLGDNNIQYIQDKINNNDIIQSLYLNLSYIYYEKIIKKLNDKDIQQTINNNKLTTLETLNNYIKKSTLNISTKYYNNMKCADLSHTFNNSHYNTILMKYNFIDYKALIKLSENHILDFKSIEYKKDEYYFLDYKSIDNNIKEECDLYNSEHQNNIDTYLFGNLYNNKSAKGFTSYGQIDIDNIIGIFFDSSKFKCYYDTNSINCEYKKIEYEEIEKIINNHNNKININDEEFFIYEYDLIKLLLTKDDFKSILSLVKVNIKIDIKFYYQDNKNSGIIFIPDNK